MKQIEIKTSDQVLINFNIAGLRDRAFAFLIDQLILYGVILVLSITGGIINAGELYWVIVVIPVFLFYTLIFEITLGGITPGKKAIGVRVVKLNGHYATPVDYILRWLFRWLDIWMSLTVIGSVLINSNRYGQRLGDLMAGTTLIKVKSGDKISLKEILSIDSSQDYTPVYPQVTLLNDEDLLLVKRTMHQARQYNNTAHRKAIDLLVKHLADELQISDPIKNKGDFLNTLLKDYVVLTR